VLLHYKMAYSAYFGSKTEVLLQNDVLFYCLLFLLLTILEMDAAFDFIQIFTILIFLLLVNF